MTNIANIDNTTAPVAAKSLTAGQAFIQELTVDNTVLGKEREAELIAFGKADAKFTATKAAFVRSLRESGITAEMFKKGSNADDHVYVINVEGDACDVTHIDMYNRLRALVVIAYNTPNNARLILTDRAALNAADKKAKAKLKPELQKVGRNMANWSNILTNAAEAAENGAQPGGRTVKELFDQIRDAAIQIDKRARSADFGEEGDHAGQKEFDATRIATLASDMLECLGVDNPNLDAGDTDSTEDDDSES